MWTKRICWICDNHCLNNDDGLTAGCRAFPNGIPNWIGNEHSHDNIIEGQVGDFVFTPAKREFNIRGNKISDY